MEKMLQEKFLSGWKKYFAASELPIAFFYTDDPGTVERAKPARGHRCLICELARVRQGMSLAFDREALACGGARRYAGFDSAMAPNFKYFLSCGIPGVMAGERYKKNPELVIRAQKEMKQLKFSGKTIVFKRWDDLGVADEPAAVIFFANADVLCGLFTLANYDETEANGVIAPFAAGCGSIIHYPFLENESSRPRAVLGMFDPSARPCVKGDTLTFAVPMKKFRRMVADMDESFLITPTWKRIRKRIESVS